MGVFLVALASLLWAIDTLIRYPLLFSGVSATKIVFSEHLLLVLFMSPVLIKMMKKAKEGPVRNIWSFVIIGGLGSALATLAFTKAFSLINPSLVILLQKFQPLIAILLAAKILHEPLKKKFIGWALLCLIGGVLISYEDIARGIGEMSQMGEESWFDRKTLVGYFLTLLAIIGWGSSTVFGKRLVAKGHSENEVMAGRFFFGFLFLLPMLAGEEFPFISDSGVWAKIFFMVIISGILGMGLYYRGLKKIPARLAALAEMFFPFCAIAVNWIFLGAKLAPLQILGGALLLIGSGVLQRERY